jgi:hypothetical protein
MEFFKDGEPYATSTFPSGQLDIGNQPAELGVKLVQFRTRRDQAWELGRGTTTEWTFETSRPEGDTVVPLPVSIPNYDAPVDGRNLAPAAPDFPVSVTFQGQDGYAPGEIVQFTAKVSFEPITVEDAAGFGRPLESLNWVEVPVVRQNGRWMALVDGSSASGKVASMWITAEDSHGTRTEQFTWNLFGIQ